jgi:hypothetical protein
VTSTTGQEQWYLARDGKQHGPLSDTEMQKLVELGHLKAADLVWRPGFPDWRLATTVFPSLAQKPEPAPAPQPAPTPGATQQTAAAPSPSVQPTQPAPQTTARPAAAQPRTMTGAMSQMGQMGQMTQTPRTEHAAPLQPQATDAFAPARSEPARGGAFRGVAIALAMLVIILGGAFAAYKNQDAVKAYIATMTPAAQPPAAQEPAKDEAAKLDEAKPVDIATTTATAATPAATPEPPPAPTLNTDAIDKQFQRTPLWNLLKAEFPEWYTERVNETARLAAENRPESEVIGKIVEALVNLRRQNADKALSASTAKLQEIATAFLGNLRALQTRNVDSCYGFISKSEAEPSVIELMQKAEESAPIQAQLQAIFSAAVEGRKSPVQHAMPEKSDYDLLAAELGTLGWSQADIQLFADPKALAQAPRDRVCKMVQDWFAAHLAIKDAAAQERLLFETLRPVVNG